MMIVDKATQNSAAQRITALALERFLTEGYSNVSVDALSRELRISKKTLYEHFSSKEVLAQRALAQHLEALRADIEQIVQGEGTFRGKLAAFLESVHERLGWPEPAALEDLRESTPRVWNYLTEFRRDTVTGNLTALLEEGKREGELRADVDAPLVVEMMLTSLEALTRPGTLQAHQKSAAEMVTFAVRTVVDGCAAKQP